jgi:hypothetical protein
MKQNVIDFPSDTYPAGFWKWLSENEAVYDAFKIEAIRMALTGRKRYSARTIVELLRCGTTQVAVRFEGL